MVRTLVLYEIGSSYTGKSALRVAANRRDAGRNSCQLQRVFSRTTFSKRGEGRKRPRLRGAAAAALDVELTT